MTLTELYTLLDMPVEAVALLDAAAQTDLSWLTEEMISRYYTRATAAEGLEAIRAHLGEDPDGFRLLWVLLTLCCRTWAQYEALGIPAEVFAATMKFIPRFLRDHHAKHGNWNFNWGWWFWRQLSMAEFRVGCLEYEFIRNADGEGEVSLHIPADADLSPASVDASFAAFRDFMARFYPEWAQEKWVCDSWMMSPVLENFLDEGSNVLAFQRRFIPEHTGYGYEGVLDWVFPPHREVSCDLPENTSLQRRLKPWLLAGNKVGWTRAVLRT